MRTGRCGHVRCVVAAALILVAAATGTAAASTARRPTTTSTTAPPTTTTTAPAATPGGSVAWHPAGRQVLGQTVLYLGSGGGATLAWMPPNLVRPVVVPGTGDPGGPWPWGGQVDSTNRPNLVAAFNGGFKFGDFTGGVLAFGHTFRDLAAGQASFVVFADGTFTVGLWGRDVTPGPNVVAVRQNLSLLVDGGAPTADAGSSGSWGASVGGVETQRSGVGVDAKGGLIWAGGGLSPEGLASALVAAGAVRGMQMDINPSWVNFNLYQPAFGGGVHGVPVYGATGPDRYLSPNSRDFIAVLIRAAVVAGTPGKVGLTPVDGKVHIP
ncbi:MAG TPA: hypothetical protein VLV81_04040 [Acidimicrobiia bacterium]|nr:hypothetical protein [Acidimicrobiia bacterium]